MSHHKRGWEKFTDAVVQIIAKNTPVGSIFMGKIRSRKMPAFNRRKQ